MARTSAKARAQIPEAATVAAVMSAAVCVRDTTTVDAVRVLFSDHRVTAVAVVDPDGSPIGFLTPRDLVTGCIDDLDECERVSDDAGLRYEAMPRPVRDVMMPFAFTIDERTPLDTAAKLMACEGISHVAVIDRARRVVGLVSALDVVRRVVTTGELA